MLVLHVARGFAVLDSRKRLLGGAVISIVGLGTALFFRKPPEEPRNVAWPSGFTEVQPSAPLANPTPPEPVQPRLAGRIESLAEAPTSTAPAAGSMYQMPGSANSLAGGNQSSASAPSDPFLRGGSSFSMTPANAQPASGNASSGSPATETANLPAKVYKLEELTPLVPTNQATSPAPTSFAEPAKLDPAQQAAATSLAAASPAVEHSSGYRWSPNRSSVGEPPANALSSNGNLALAERPSLLAPPPMSAPPSAASNTFSAPPPVAAAPATGYQMPRADSTPSLSLPNYGYAPAPLLSSAPANAPLQQSGSGMRHRIVDGDTLATIARRYYGDEQRARELFEANRGALRDPELLPIGTELLIPGGSPNTMAPPPATYPPMSQAAPLSQGVPPLLAPPALEQFGPRTLAVSTSSWRGANEPAQVLAAPASPLAPVALSPWDQQLANATPLQQSAPANLAAPPALYGAPADPNAPPIPPGWPPTPMGTMPGALPGNAATTPQVGWPPQPATTPANWPTRAWNSSESAMNWVGNKVLGTGPAAAPTAGSRTYLVKPLETWETLAQRFYGDPRQATTLQSANQQVPAGSKIRPGTVITVPNMPL